jgi:hypothetical protein
VQPSRVVESQSSVPVSYSSTSVQGGETVRKHGLSVPITPARDHVRKVCLRSLKRAYIHMHIHTFTYGPCLQSGMALNLRAPTSAKEEHT